MGLIQHSTTPPQLQLHDLLKRGEGFSNTAVGGIAAGFVGGIFGFVLLVYICFFNVSDRGGRLKKAKEEREVRMVEIRRLQEEHRRKYEVGRSGTKAEGV